SVSTSHNSGQEKTGAPGSSLDMALWVKQILARRRPVLIAELRDGDDYGLLSERERDRTLRQLGYTSVIGVPLAANDQVVGALVRGVATTAQAGTDSHVIELDLSESCLAEVDALRLEQVISNLFSNAVKYSPEGGPIHVELRRARQSVLLRIRDWGVGIPPE